jgi:parallel beta-helix repeat protein
MNRKLTIIVLLALTLLTINVCAAQELDNSTEIVDELSVSEESALEVANDTQVLEAASTNTHIDVAGKTDFDVIGDYFKVKLSDSGNNLLKNTKVTFTVNGKTYSQNTDSNGIASLQIRLNDGSYSIVTKFAGNSKYKASSLTAKITMDNTREVESGLSNSQIQNIIDNAKVNNVILFKGKSYSDINLVIEKSLTLLSNVGTTLKSGSSSPVISIKGSKASLTTVKGFKIEGNGDGVKVDGSNYVKIINNDITTKGNGIISLNTKYLNVTKNNIVKNSKSGIVIAESSYSYIFNNKITNNGKNGIEVAKSENIYINGNIISENGKNGIFLSNSINDNIYSTGPGNVYIRENSIVDNGKSGILVEKALNNININSNDISSNWDDGISIARIGSNKIQSNVITHNHGAGLNFFGGYVMPDNQDISYNAIFGNVAREIEAKDTLYDGGANPLRIGANWYSDSNTLCPKIKTKQIQFVVKQTGKNQFQASFVDQNGNIAGLLPDRVLSYNTNDGKYVSITMKGGVATFTVDAKDGDIVNAVVDKSPREKEYNSNTPNSKPVNGKTPTYTYPDIPDYQYYEDIGSGSGNANGNGNGNGGGNGNGNGEGSGGDASKGNGLSQPESSSNNGNSTYSQRTDPGKSANNQFNDVSQSYETDVTTSQASASEASNGNTGTPGSQQQDSVVKQIIIDEDEFFKITGISFIVLLMILTIGFYYRDDIREMKSKM